MRTVTFHGSQGSFTVDADTGVVISHAPDPEPENGGYLDLIRVDLTERREWYARHGITLSDPQPDGDVLDVGAWFATTGYCEPAIHWRRDTILPLYADQVLAPDVAKALKDIADKGSYFSYHIRKVGYASQDLTEAAEAMEALLPDAMAERLTFAQVSDRLTAIRDLLTSFLLDAGGDNWEDFPEIDGARLDMERRAHSQPVLEEA